MNGRNKDGDELISRRAVLDGAVSLRLFDRDVKIVAVDYIEQLPAAQPEKETPKRVLWTGWKGYRDTRYKCPNCKKPVKNDDVYCHRCGQKLMFPHVDWTPYVEGQKQELIVRWDDE